jgi:hypothetical protein
MHAVSNMRHAVGLAGHKPTAGGLLDEQEVGAWNTESVVPNTDSDSTTRMSDVSPDEGTEMTATRGKAGSRRPLSEGL